MLVIYRAKHGEGPVLEVEYDPATQKVVEVLDGGELVGLAVVALTADEIQQQVDQMRSDVLSRISIAFHSAQYTGRIDLSLGWPIDCRRGPDKNDLQNIEVLRDRMDRLGQQSAVIVGADDIGREVTRSEVDLVIAEMQDYGLWLYQYKWGLEGAARLATTPAELAAVTW